MFFCTTHCFLGPKAKHWCLDVRQSIPFSLNIRCFVLFMPKLCFIHYLFLLSNFIMHALFVFTKCILHPSGWLKQVFVFFLTLFLFWLQPQQYYLFPQILFCFYVFKHTLCIISYQEDHYVVIYFFFQAWMWMLFGIICVNLPVLSISLPHLMYSRLYLGNKNLPFLISTLAFLYFSFIFSVSL